MKLVTGIYNSLLWGLLLATLLFNDTWLQMRVNIGYLFFASWLLFVIIWYLINRRRHTPSVWLTIINTVVIIGIAVLVEGLTNLLVIPATFIREGLHLDTISFTTINLILITVIIVGFLLILWRAGRQHNR